jgi:hypothetical protein
MKVKASDSALEYELDIASQTLLRMSHAWTSYYIYNIQLSFSRRCNERSFIKTCT